MLYVKPVPVLVPAEELYGLVYPSCFNSISPTYDTAFLVCSYETGPDTFSVDPETTKYRDRLVKLFIGEKGLYATPYFAETAFGCWKPGGAYILVPLESCDAFGAGYKLAINNTAVPLYDFWDKASEPNCELELPF